MPLNTIVCSMASSARRAIIQNAPAILGTVGIIGVGVTAVLVAKETPKAQKAIEEFQKSKEAGDDKKVLAAKAGEVTKHYIPAIAAGVCTIVCIGSAVYIGNKQKADLAAAFASLATYHNAYRNKVIDICGEEVDEKITSEIQRFSPDFHATDVDTPDYKMTFIDPYGYAVTCYEREIMDAEYHFNRNYCLSGAQSLAEFHTMANMKGGDEVWPKKIGWSHDSGLYWVDFEHHQDKKDPTICHIEYTFAPAEEYLEGYFY